MTKTDWQSRWDDGRTGFHQSSVSPALERYAARFLPESGGRVLVPLCGKTLDLVWIAQRGHQVCGVEFVEDAVVQFFAEHEIEHERRDLEAIEGAEYDAGHIRILAADFFQVTQDMLGDVSAVFDRASIVALPPELRKKFGQRLTDVVPTGAKMLMVTFAYDQTEMSGPPYSVEADEVRELFGSGFELEILEEGDALDRNPKFRNRGLERLKETVWLLTKR